MKARLVGLDVARALAVLGMVLVNFKIVMGASGQGPDWLVRALGAVEGRAAATFVVLAGVGVSLLSARARRSEDPSDLPRVRRTLLVRAMALFFIGLAYTPLWPADILHFYGLYLAVGAVLLSASPRRVLLAAAGFTVGFVVLFVLFDYETGWNWETLEYRDLWTLEGLVRHMFFNGFHPVFPWAAFLLFGMWLGRRDLGDPSVRRRLLAGAAGVLVAVELASRVAIAALSRLATGIDAADLPYLVGTGPMPPMPTYVLAGGATATLVTVACLQAVEGREGRAVVRALRDTGQLALTHYVAHVVFGMGTLDALGLLGGQTLAFAAACALGFWLIAVAFSVAWRSRFDRGPLEAALRRLTG